MSRLKGHAVSLIADGMDQCKFQLPRTAIMKGKEFGTMQKVKLHISLAIVHGRLVLFTISSADTKKDPNSSIELVCAVLSLLKRQGQHLPSTTLFLQHDNCCREFKKKNSSLRWAASQVSSKNFAAIHCSYLRAGHTHEDVDGVFGNLTKYMVKQRNLQCPEDVREMILAFLRETKMPFEGERHCLIMDSVRDWRLGRHLLNVK